MAKYLDNTNLGYLISKIKAAFWPKADVTNITLSDVAVTGDYEDLSNKPTIPDAVCFTQQSLTDAQKAQARANIGAYTKPESGIPLSDLKERVQRVVGSENQIGEGDIFTRVSLENLGSEMVNSFTSQYFYDSYLQVSLGGDPKEERVVIHDDDRNIDLFEVVTYDGGYFGYIKNDKEIYVGELGWGLEPVIIEIDFEYQGDRLTISSNESTSNVSIRTGDPLYDKYERIGGENCLRQPSSPLIETEHPSEGMFPNRIYDFGTVEYMSFYLFTPARQDVINHYYWRFQAGADPYISWPDPSEVTWVGGSEPTVIPGKRYEVSVLNGIGVCMEV